MLLTMAKGEGQLQTLTNIQIETSDLELVTHQSYYLPFNSESCISEKEIDMFVENPRLLLQACTMHFNKFLFSREGKETNIVESMFFSEEAFDLIWEFSKQIFI